MTIGDILAVVAAVFIVGATWAATILLLTLAFPSKIARAQEAVTRAPGRCAARGLGLLFVVGLLAIVLGQSHAGPVRILAGALWASLGALAALGSGGIVRLIGTRIDEAGSPMTPFASRTRAALLYVAAGFFPVLGWFAVTPLAALVTIGAGWSAVRSKSFAPTPASPPLPRAAGEGPVTVFPASASDEIGTFTGPSPAARGRGGEAGVGAFPS